MSLWKAIKVTGSLIKGTYQVTKTVVKATGEAVGPALDALNDGLEQFNENLGEFSSKLEQTMPFQKVNYIASMNVNSVNCWLTLVDDRRVLIKEFFDTLIILNQRVDLLFKRLKSDYDKYEPFIENAKGLSVFQGFGLYDHKIERLNMTRYGCNDECSAEDKMKTYLQDYGKQIERGDCWDNGLGIFMPLPNRSFRENIDELNNRIKQLDLFLATPQRERG